MHSTFGTLLFSYGIVGFAVFCVFLYQIFRKATIRYFAYFIPICVYGLTHQGLRTTGFWVFLALVFGLANVKGMAREGAAPGRRVRAAISQG